MDHKVRLAEVSYEMLFSVFDLEVAPEQAQFVAPNVNSIAEASFDRGAWYRAIASGEDLVGFAMLFDPTQPGASPWPEYERDTILLWRFMIDRRWQRRGLGAAAITCLAEHVRSRPGISRFATSYSEGPGGPADFYLRVGFIPTGRHLEEEAEAIMAL